MSEYIKPEKTIWKMADGSFFEGPMSELPKSGASKIAKAGVEVSKEWLKAQGWKEAKKAPAKKAPAKKAAPKKAVETKAVKPSEDK
jgi:hypothetical protein